MATYLELAEIGGEAGYPAFRKKVRVAAADKATRLLGGATPTANEVAWAVDALRDPDGKGDELIAYVLASNKGATIAAILSASDNAIQTNVDTAADAIIAGGAV